LQLPPPDAILSNVYKTFEECNPIKRFQNKHNAKHSENEFLKPTEKRSQNNSITQHLQNKVLTHNLKAFTLAEVLIALVIIGIVAAITVPTIVSNYQEKAKISKIKKIYSTLSNALTRVRADGGTYILEDETLNDDLPTVKNWYNNYLKPYLITTKVCYNEIGCWGKNTKFLKGTNTYVNNNIGIGSPVVTAILNDGTYINIDRDGCNGLARIKSSNSYCIRIDFDINGAKGPNVVGKDIFTTAFTEYGLQPAYNTATKALQNSDCSSTGTGCSCILKYLKEN
jgi:prepilin-type N-terminal cleavage/methylation domain-containing protein